MNIRLTRAQDLNNDSDAATNTWTIAGHVNLFLSDYDPVHSANLKGLSTFCLYTDGIDKPKNCLVPIELIHDIVEFDKIIARFDRLTSYKCKEPR